MFSIKDVPISQAGFFINLDTSTERLQNVNDQVSHFGIKGLERYPALTNHNIPQSSATDSHLAVFDHCLKNNIDTVTVFEDDFQFHDNVYGMRSYGEDLAVYLSSLMQSISSLDWDVIFLGFNPKKRCIPINTYLTRVFKSTGAWGYIINKKAYTRILETTNYSRDRLAIDDILPFMSYQGFNCFATIIPVCHHGVNFISTLQPSLGPIDYSEWILGNYHLNVWNGFNTSVSDIHDFGSYVYESTLLSRSNKINIKEFDNDITKLINFAYNYPDYSNCFIQLPDYISQDIRYYINIESSVLFHTREGFSSLTSVPQNDIDILI